MERAWKGKRGRECKECLEGNEARDFALLTGVKGIRGRRPKWKEGEERVEEWGGGGAAHLRHLEYEMEQGSEVGKRLMARLERAMDGLEEISGEARGVQDWDNAQKALLAVARVVEVAGRVSGVIQERQAAQVVVEQKPLAVQFDVRKLAETYTRTALDYQGEEAHQEDGERKRDGRKA